MLFRSSHEMFNRILFRDIGRYRNGPSALSFYELDRLVQLVFRPCTDSNRCASIGQCQGKRTPDTSPSTGYEGDLSSQVNIAFQLIILHSILRHISDVQAFRISRRDSTRSISGLMPSSVEIASDSSNMVMALSWSPSWLRSRSMSA